MEMTVKIRIKDDLLRCFLGALFEKRRDGFLINPNTLTGAAIGALVRTADYPPREQGDDSAVTFYLPKSHYNDSLRNKYLYLPPGAETKVNACLRQEFDARFFYFSAEARFQGYKQKDIIPIFMLENRIEILDGDIEAPKKRLYRKEIEMLETIEEKLLRRLYLSARKVRKTMTDHVTY